MTTAEASPAPDPPSDDARGVQGVAMRPDDADGPDAIAGFDAGLRMTFVNQAAAHLVGQPVP
jgi:hypothetical protein